MATTSCRLDFQPLWESGYLSSSQLRLDHWSVALVGDVTSGFYAKLPCAGKNGGVCFSAKNKPVSKDVFYVGMFWIVQRKAYKKTGTYFKATRNRSQQASRCEGYLYNDCHE